VNGVVFATITCADGADKFGVSLQTGALSLLFIGSNLILFNCLNCCSFHKEVLRCMAVVIVLLHFTTLAL